jgi:hypothetical protein
MISGPIPWSPTIHGADRQSVNSLYMDLSRQTYEEIVGSSTGES